MMPPTRDQMIAYLDVRISDAQDKAMINPRNAEYYTAESGILAAIRDLIQSSASGWQPIATLPEALEFFLGSWRYRNGASDDVGELSRERGHFYDITGAEQHPSHWMPLPSAPKESA